MKELLDKISSYNIFNYLLPGVVFSILISNFTELKLTFDNLFISAFAYYFIGLIVSRIGSIIVEPILKWIKLLKSSDYKEFIEASAKDSKIELLSEINNMYRTIVSMFILFLLTLGFLKLAGMWKFLENNKEVVCFLLLAILFILSYIKQTNYITKRIKYLM